MRRARARELNEDAVPAVVLQMTKDRLRDLFPVRFSAVDPFAEAEPSRAALVQLESGPFVVINHGAITQRVTISVPRSADVATTIAALLREVAILPDEIVWAAERAASAVRAHQRRHRDRLAAVGFGQSVRRTGTDSRTVRLSDHSESELRAREQDLREQLFKLRFQRATGRVENPMKMRRVRREIAQIQTLLNEQDKAKA